MKDATPKLVLVLVCLAVCLGVLVPSLATGESNRSGVKFSVELSAVRIEKSESDQTVTMTVKANKAVEACSIGFTVEHDSQIRLSAFVDGSNIPYGKIYFNAANGVAGWHSEDTEDLSGITTLAVIEFTIPADTPVGTYYLGVSDLELATDHGKNIWESTAAASAKLMMVDPNAIDDHYTATIADATSGTAKVHNDDAVAMTVSLAGADSSAKFSRAELVVKYDQTHMSYVNATSTDPTVTVTPDTANGKISIVRQGGDIASLTFTVLNFTAVVGDATAVADFTFASAKVTDSVSSLNMDMRNTATAGDRVEVVKAFKIQFINDDGTALYGPFYVDQDGTLSSAGKTVSDFSNPAKENYVFDGWLKDSGTTAISVNDILTAAVTADVTYQAKFSPKSGITVVLGENVEKLGETANTAAYLTDYNVKIADTFYDDANYNYTVTYTIGGGDVKNAVLVSAADGTYSVPGTEITDTLSISVVRVLDNTQFEIATYSDYVTGYLLVTVTYQGSHTAPAYTFDGSTMFDISAVYDSSKTIYGWLTNQTLGDTADARNAAAAAKIGITSGSAEIVSVKNYDVNDTGATDGADVDLTWQCYNVTYAVADTMGKYLAADVNHDYKVDISDTEAVAAYLAGN